MHVIWTPTADNELIELIEELYNQLTARNIEDRRRARADRKGEGRRGYFFPLSFYHVEQVSDSITKPSPFSCRLSRRLALKYEIQWNMDLNLKTRQMISSYSKLRPWMVKMTSVLAQVFPMHAPFWLKHQYYPVNSNCVAAQHDTNGNDITAPVGFDNMNTVKASSTTKHVYKQMHKNLLMHCAFYYTVYLPTVYALPYIRPQLCYLDDKVWSM